jgi:hypothetical protein
MGGSNNYSLHLRGRKSISSFQTRFMRKHLLNWHYRVVFSTLSCAAPSLSVFWPACSSAVYPSTASPSPSPSWLVYVQRITIISRAPALHATYCMLLNGSLSLSLHLRSSRLFPLHLHVWSIPWSSIPLHPFPTDRTRIWNICAICTGCVSNLFVCLLSIRGVCVCLYMGYAGVQALALHPSCFQDIYSVAPLRHFISSASETILCCL